MVNNFENPALKPILFDNKIVKFANMTAYFFHDGVWHQDGFVSSQTVKKCDTFSGNPVKFDQSDDDFETPKVFPILCALCIKLQQHWLDQWREFGVGLSVCQSITDGGEVSKKLSLFLRF